ncbi:trem-like transcript 2 protein isoform X1 [Mus musculus]|uniref:Trem-like transcript 2 protein n=1 Tax=Mus musculus TaxID=10090 RepID=TRML2_MOUSE|nr:trem-like transcript 2 protein isoform 1 precursor [Mus musculus]XP_006524503.1 trem-like transcript 2 protein isoform X1 [Mus musculus]XP_006524504.1 trem-like transcript 2 protein isoform X1 [Mus musculus]Q2LA85.2 RecName: Full=Trem-like transcript 2 protein; Short=TLT-2; AltName: Full=Triggering receptor expressed on myeloid cells-like protein 2; Flags: Precursor [Mus musculus]AAI60362.1 Triggering receptor expressed on myeloid cells-like 2 [synthetic construct]ABA38680.1 triggering rece|eukprot:NP_001028577.2 trem-like transcript 2 protein isoform 1 precursor [Mus musculus]
MEPWPLTFLLLLLLLLWLQGCVSGHSNENLYRKVWRREGETLSVQCSYKNRRNLVEAKSWCKVKKKKCDHNFTRSWVRGPSYSLRDDAKVKVVRITMEALRVQDSGRYWCMRNTAGHFYPLVGFQLEVYPALTTERNVPHTHLTNTPMDGFVTTGQVHISDPHAPFTSDVTMFTSEVTMFTSGLLTLASGTTTPTPVTGYSFIDTSGTVTEPERNTESQPATLSPSNARSFSADPVTTSTMSRHQSSSLSTTGTCHPLTPNRSQETYIPAMVVVLTFLPAPVVLVVAYGFWKKRHMGRYNLGSNYAKPWIHLPEGPETPWKPAWSKITQ